ncbi:MYND-type domain-containing protein [Caerostris darwini]|uniref:MYND-type domain-containing protein n=1 Tax=Caerostris darwini TaxID=1538125 RepID=A0AAV4MSQ3_9ARAC|nr:MYND-type domain-containing protein [Caerostris darwini]
MENSKGVTYKPGDMIYKSKPYVRVIRQDLWDKVCGYCLKDYMKLKRCGSCQKIKYCGKICQKAAWNDHKLECPFLPGYVNEPNQLLIHLTGNLILKIKGKDWKSITENVAGKVVSFDDLASHATEMNTPWNEFVIKNTQQCLERYIGKDNVPDEETLLAIVRKVACNNFTFGGENPVIRALFIGASKFDHSCVPNAKHEFPGEHD